MVFLKVGIMDTIEFALDGLKLLKSKVFEDSRGFFLESYRKSFYKELGIDVDFLQDNLVFSHSKVIRGMHFQTEPGQDKLIYVVQGEILDVAVDIRPNSPTFGKYHAEVLNDKNRHQFFIPHGFAHGYCVLSDSAYVAYKVSNVYLSDKEVGFKYNDPKIGIQWPVKDPIISEKDQNNCSFDEIDFSKWF